MTNLSFISKWAIPCMYIVHTEISDVFRPHSSGGGLPLFIIQLYIFLIFCFRLSRQITSLARQKVRPAYETVSASCGLALRRYMPDKKAEADFFFVIDSGMDVLNGGHPKDPKPLRRGYSGTPEQEAALTALVEEMSAMRIGSVRHLLPFQKGLLVTVRSVRGLLGDVRQRYGADCFLLPRHLTQDRLECV